MFRAALLATFFTTYAVAQPQAPAPCLTKPAAERPYTKDRLFDIIRDQTPARAEYLIRACGVSLAWSEALVPELKAANANDQIIQAVRDVTKPKGPPPPTGPKPGEIRTNNKEGVTYAYIPPGTFEMGCNNCEAGVDEKPVHKVRITKGFWMAQHEVTTRSYKNYVKAAGGRMPDEPTIGPKSFNPGWATDTLPVSMIHWVEAENYCQWAGMRLPTEAEWEYAARGPAGLPPQEITDVAWYSDNSGRAHIDGTIERLRAPNDWIRKLLGNGNGPHDVGQKAPNGWKLYDMLGNVWEWTSDWYREDAYAASRPDDPQGPDAGIHHVLRGGSWLNVPNYVRLTKRLKGIPGQRIYTNGFRCAGSIVR